MLNSNWKVMEKSSFYFLILVLNARLLVHYTHLYWINRISEARDETTWASQMIYSLKKKEFFHTWNFCNLAFSIEEHSNTKYIFFFGEKVGEEFHRSFYFFNSISLKKPTLLSFFPIFLFPAPPHLFLGNPRLPTFSEVAPDSLVKASDFIYALIDWCKTTHTTFIHRN